MRPDLRGRRPVEGDPGTFEAGNDPGRRRVSMLTGLFVVAAAILVATGLFLLVVRGGLDPGGDTGSSAGAAAGADEGELTTQGFERISQHRGPAYAIKDYRATEDQPQSKLWFAKGAWWGVLVDRPTRATHIFKWAAGRWKDTGVVVDSRENSHSDVVWTGERLYVGSRLLNGTQLLTRFEPSGRSWAPLGPPVTIATGGASSLSIAVDSRSRVWATYNQAGRVWLTHSTPGGAEFAAPSQLPGPNRVHADDTAAVAAGDGQIMVMWSNQVTASFQFATRKDSAPLDRILKTRPPVSDLRIADGHIQLLPGNDGRLYAAVKTSLGDEDIDPPHSPLLVLLERSPAGRWSQHTVATTADQMTRPRIALSQDGRLLYFVATSPQTGGAVYVKVAHTGSLNFPSGLGTPILDAAGARINDATLTRQRVSARTGILVLASDKSKARYWTAEIPLGQ